MAHVIVLGAGLGGMPLAYEMKSQLRKSDRVTVVGNGPNFQFVPSNPWVAVRWRKRSDVEFAAAPPIRVPSWSVPCRARRATARRTSSRSSWIRTCVGGDCATGSR